MNKWRTAAVLIIAALATWLVVRSCTPQKPVPVTQTPPAREEFHASKPLRVQVLSAPAAADKAPADQNANEWLERELRYLLTRGRMRVAPIGITDATSFTLRIDLPPEGQPTAKMTLLAPDGEARREATVTLANPDKLSLMLALAKQLPDFLGAVHEADWSTYIGIDDTATYDNFIRSSTELLGAHGHGFTQPAPADRSRAVQRLETIARKSPQSARAWSLLSIGYLSLGGEDQASLAHIAESRAERALALDPQQADAQSALGLVRLRRGEWAAATEYFNAALALDANAIAALEGSACLLVDVGHERAALPIAQRAVALQPDNAGANTCLAYAQLANNSATEVAPNDPLPVARVKVLATILSADPTATDRSLRNAPNVERDNPWLAPLLQATTEKRRRSEAIRAITLAASDGSIDPSIEILSGAALRQPDFVFNRMLRLRKQNQPVPLRVLWLPHAAFLRKHQGFEDIISASGLLPFWQDHGPPDICASEPNIYSCKLGKATSQTPRTTTP